MSKRSRRPLLWLTAAACGLWLAGCTTPSGLVGVDTSALEDRARAAAQTGDMRTAADLYVQLAEQTAGATRAGFLLEASRAELQLTNLLSARELIGRARSDASAAQLDEAQRLLARIELAEQRPGDALARVQPMLESAEPAALAEVLEIQGLALFALGRPVEAIQSLSEREVWLDEITDIRSNQRTLWRNIATVTEPATGTGDAVVDGWLSLAPIARMSAEEAQRRALLEWRRTHLQHPAARILLTELLMGDPALATAPRQIALLLPLGTAAREPARAIRDGFLAAHLTADADREGGARRDDAAASATTIRIYDTGTEGAEAAYLRAQVEGADFIVGPLLRAAVQSVLLQSGLVPTLTLNYTLDDAEVFGNTYQFALSPDDEAVAVARRAMALGQRRAVALIPSNDRGYRIYNSFVQEYEALGGEILAFMGYDDAIETYGTRISTLLNLDRSSSRERTLQANLRETIEFEPRRRQDIDMIFVIANAADGRQLVPQLEYYYAGDIPTYSISEIYEPAARERESDLNRVIFPDVPWLLEPDAATLRVRRTIEARWPTRSVAMARFFGMGMDSYRIVQTLYRDPFFTSIEGATGVLRMDTNGRIHRELPFAQFRGGLAQLLEQIEPQSDAPRQSPAAFNGTPEREVITTENFERVPELTR